MEKSHASFKANDSDEANTFCEVMVSMRSISLYEAEASVRRTPLRGEGLCEAKASVRRRPPQNQYKKNKEEVNHVYQNQSA